MLARLAGSRLSPPVGSMSLRLNNAKISFNSFASQACPTASSSQEADVVVLDYDKLTTNNSSMSQQIKQAYGEDGLGILVVRGIPNYLKLRENLLPLASRFARLPDPVKEKYVHAKSFYSFGWSHGKEQFEGKPDLAKGSYYNNPQYDRPTEDTRLIEEFPEYCHPNIWPSQELPQLENAFKALGQLMVQVGLLVARQCDTYVESRCPTYQKGRLEHTIATSKACKARLLHYFPTPDAIDDSTDVSSWCGWHNDHGTLTGLTSALYFRDSKDEMTSNPDPNSGLYVRSRWGDIVKIGIPADCLGFQIGESAQIHSGGLLQATPHCVRAAIGPRSFGISRNTFAVFMQPQWDELMNVPKGVDAANAVARDRSLPPGVPKLANRWRHTQDFAEFTKATLEEYYQTTN
eukprot:GILJ01002575.1.p1 GENE.GILJ01002575.1~~GILJ01002575.1.p1  ORF type:complete len:417 (-),score=45.76 GILJ01002575.1:199-1413(-)